MEAKEIRGIATEELVVKAKELKEELKGNNKLEKEIDLLISQSDRCNQILKKLSTELNFCVGRSQVRSDFKKFSISF